MYCDILEENEENNYYIDDIDELRYNEEYQYFIKYCLSTKLDRQITINNISLEKLIQESFEIDGSLSKFQ